MDCFAGKCIPVVVLIGLIAVLGMAGLADAATYRTGEAGMLLPDPQVTPGVVRPLGLQAICRIKWGKDRRHVTTRMRVAAYAAYGVRPGPDCCELDHLVPRELGGADVLANLFPQLWGQAHLKDRLENRVHALVCVRQLPLMAAQRGFMQDWTRLYFEVFGEAPHIEKGGS